MATIYERVLKNGTSWTLQWMDGGKRNSRALGFITQQEAKLALLQHEAGVDSKLLESVNVPLFEVYADTYKRWHAEEQANASIRVAGMIDQHFVPWLKGIPLDEITLDNVEKYRRMRLKTRAYPNSRVNFEFIKPATVNKEIVQLKALLNHAINRDVISKHNLRLLKKLPEYNTKEIEYFTDTQLELLFDDPEHGQLWRLMAYTGMRRAEAMHLTWTDIDDRFISIKSTAEQRTKSGKGRLIVLGENSRRALLDIWRKTADDQEIDSYPQIGGRVIPYVNKDTISNYAKAAIRRGGLTGSLHKFRHTYISMLAMKGVPVLKIQQMAGHATIAMTMRYMHLSPDYLADVAEYS